MERGIEHAASKLIEGIYDAALDQAQWKAILGNIAEFVGGTGAILYSHDLSANQVTWSTFVGMDPDGIQSYEQYYSKIDARYAPALTLPSRTVLTEGMIMERKDLQKTEFYQDFLRRYDIPYIAASILHTDPEFVAISVQGTRQHGPFDAEQLKRLQFIVPHLARAVQIGNRIGTYRNRIDSLRQLLDAVAFGAVALDEYGSVVETNEIARRAFERGDAFIYQNNLLRARTACADRALRCLINSAIAPTLDNPRTPLTAAVPRVDGRRGYTVVAAKTPAKFVAGNGRCVAYLILIDHDVEPPSLRNLLVARFGLTPAESAVAALLFSGSSIRGISESRRTSVDTTRKQLKSLFAKCGTKNQAQLMRLFAELATVTQAHSSPPSVQMHGPS